MPDADNMTWSSMALGEADITSRGGVTASGPAGARLRFGDVLALYDIGLVDGAGIVDAAVQLLVDGIGGDAVVALACVVAPSRASRSDVDDLVVAAREELGMARLDEDQALIRAASPVVRRWMRGELTDRQLTSWAHAVITHYRGSRVIQELVYADDRLDTIEYSTDTAETIHEDLVRIAAEMMVMPDPWA